MPKVWGLSEYITHSAMENHWCLRSSLVPAKSIMPTLPSKINQDNKAINPGFITRFSQCFIGLWWLLQLLWNTIVDVFLFTATAFVLRDTQTPIRGPPGSEYNPRRIVFWIVSLDHFRLVKNAMNLVILSALFVDN